MKSACTMNDIEKQLASFFHKNNQVKRNIGKRFFDILFSLCILIMISPIIVLLTILVKTTSKGPVFYSSKRIGAGGQLIHCWKFRTMFVDADAKLKEILETDPEMQREWLEHYKLRNDPRITKIGSFLRKTSLDELPQFWNVLKGDLSTVGPRPLSSDEVLRVIIQGHGRMFSVKPGITGLWQTSGRNLIPFDMRIKMEEEYVEKQSFLLDLYLILKTVPMMIFPKGAF